MRLLRGLPAQSTSGRYAPAYERFGAQISAIHFIGPNKPWTAIPYRAPGSATFREQVHTRNGVYDYPSLVDRWFAVYDTHYRVSSPAPSPIPFEVAHYGAAWDTGAVGVPAVVMAPADAGAALGLEDLRRLAVEGVDSLFAATGYRRAEGEYRRMPLDGRIDLMRPPRPPPVEEEDGELTPKQELLHLDLGEQGVRMHTLPTPGPNEAPPAPHPHPAALPASPTGQHGEHKRRHQHRRRASHPQHSLQGSSDSEPMPSPSLEQQHHHHYHHHHHHREGQKSPPLLLWNPAVDPPPNVPPPDSAFANAPYFPNVWDQPLSQVHDATHQQPSPPGRDEPEGDPFFRAPPPAPIPEPLLRQGHYTVVTADAPAPDPGKVRAVFPWEEQPRRAPSRAFPKNESPPPDLGFVPTEPPSAPPVGASSRSSSVNPTRPGMRHAPSSSLNKLGYANAWDGVPSIQKYASKLAGGEARARPPPPSFDDAGYHRERALEAEDRDADDEDDGDDDDSDDERSSRGRSVSIEPRDEEEEDDRPPPSLALGSRRTSRTRRPHSRTNSGANSPQSTTPFIAPREYRAQAVQTVVLESRSKGVQVSSGMQVSQPMPPPMSRRTSAAGAGRTQSISATRPTSDVRRTSFSKRMPQSRQGSSEDVRGRTESLPTPLRASPTLAPSQLGPAAIINPGARRTSGGKASPRLSPVRAQTPSPALSPRMASPFVPGEKRARPAGMPPLGLGLGLGRPGTDAPGAHRMERNASGASADTGGTSATESAFPGTPFDGHGPFGASAHGRPGRTFDPNTGIDVFKRGSEEVLARFLRFNSWEKQEDGEHPMPPARQ
jgi:glycogenin glucosyltransferase